MWKSGHYANQCWTKKALNDIEDENLRAQLEKVLLINPDSESEISDNEIDFINKSSSKESSSDDNCQCNDEIEYWKSIVNMNGLNVLTEEQDKTLKILESIPDNNLRRKMIEFLIKDNSKREAPQIIEAPYQISEVLSRF
jgi:hypothetical protein